MSKIEENPNTENALRLLAEESGTAIVLVDENSNEILTENDNSVCRVLKNSAEFAPRCAEFCGRAFQTAHRAGKPVAVKCHADLHFLAVPPNEKYKNFAYIIGRNFILPGDYRKFSERAAEGDFSEFPIDEITENMLAPSSVIEQERVAKKVSAAEEKFAAGVEESLRKEVAAAENISLDTTSEEDSGGIPKPDSEPFDTGATAAKIEKVQKPFVPHQAPPNADYWRSTLGSMLSRDYRRACRVLLDYPAENYAAENAAWLESGADGFEAVAARGRFENETIRIGLTADDERLREALLAEEAVELREKSEDDPADEETIKLFPVAVGGTIRAAVLIGAKNFDAATDKKIARFYNRYAAQTEILRLRSELDRQTFLAQTIKRFNEALNFAEPENFWESLADFCIDLLEAERGSLLFYDESKKEFTVKKATGRRAEYILAETETLGRKIAEGVYESGEPLIVDDLAAAGIPPAPADWKYKSESFISYPIPVGADKFGVLNVTDRAGGKKYDNFDLEVLDSIAPQIGFAFERASLKRKAGEFEQLSVTDPLTNLSNRRYLEARLEEEIKRARRGGVSMTFMMIDVDEFKSYNDKFGHVEGDKALKIVAAALRETLRGADVAARFGGEEFSILLPQTAIADALLTAERIRRKIDETTFPNRKVTVSIGVAACSQDCTMSELIDSADRALYDAKRAGRNTVRVYAEPRKTEAA